MSLKPLLSFSSGELDPVLHDHVTLEKFKKGFATARNVMVGKTGSILSRFSRAHFAKAKNNNETIKLFSPLNSGFLTEWGDLYVRLYEFDGTLVFTGVTVFTEADVSIMHFVASGPFIYAFVAGKEPIKMRYFGAGPTFESASVFFSPKSAPTALVVTPAGTPSGYAVDYLVTAVFNGEETLGVEVTTGAYNKPDATGESNSIVVQVNAGFSTLDSYSEIRIYRRPNGGGAYGFLGSSTNLYDNAGALDGVFIDLGGLADFTNGVPSIITKIGLDGQDIIDLYPSTATIYQQRILITTEDDEEAILASRPGFQNNFFRDFPYDADSALKFKSGTTGLAKVLRMVESDGLIVFTSVGVYISVGTLSIDNIALEKKGGWVINENIPPLVVPGGVFFIDVSTNTIRQLVFSNDNLTYQAIDHTIFSDHLFKQRTIESWTFQGGVTPLIIATFSDGTFATFTYNFEHQMRAWTRHDSVYPLEQVEGTGIVDASFFVTNKDGQRYIEASLPRVVPADVVVSNPESDKINLTAFMDAVKTLSNLLNDSLAGSDIFLLVPVVADDWEGDLTLTCGTSTLFPDPGLGEVGTIMRFFNILDRSVVDLEVISRTSDDEVVVTPSAEFPSAQASDFRLYETFDTVTGLDHLEGENVGILLDGAVSNSPNNDAESFTDVIVSSGSITIPNSERGAIIIVGRPIVADVKTLNISTVEQSPTLIESMTVDKLYIRFHESRGLYVGNRFPEEKTGSKDGSSVIGMEDLDIFFVPDGYDIIGNRYKQPSSERVEQTLAGEWESNGQVAIRQVDPVHFEILSIIPDVEILNRSDR